jgi:hypothetical protein
MSTTSSRNFTTLYSGAGSAVAQGAYGNANVVSLLSVGTDGANTVGNITATGAVNTTGTMSATGNIVTAGFFVGNFAGNITGNLTVPGSNTQVLFNNQGNAGAAAGLTFNSAANVLATSGNITAVGNVQGNYFLGNGSQLTGLPATYGNANVTTLLAAFGSNTISSTGNITTTANVSGGFILGNGSQLTGLPASYSNANVTTLLAAFGSNTISTTGNVTAGNFIGNGQYLTNINAGNITGSYGNANVAAFMAAFGSNTITTTGNVTAGNVSATGNITGGNVNLTGEIRLGTSTLIGGGALIAFAGAPAYLGSYNLGNTLGNALVLADGANGTIQIYSPSVANDGWVFNNANGNLTLPGNTSAINYANGANILSGIASSYGNANVATFLASFGSNTVSTTGNVTSGNLITAGVVSATGNITGANLVAAANLTSTQQTVVGTANVGTTGNIVVSGRNMATDMVFAPDGATGANLYIGRVMMGTGWAGNNAVGLGSRLATMDMINRGNTATQVRQLESEVLVNLTANVTNNTFRQQAIGGRIRVGGGSAGNTTSHSGFFAAPFTMAAAQNNLDIGNVSPYFLGNTTLSYATLNSGAIILNGGSSIGTAFGYVPAVSTGGSGASNITNYIGMASTFTGANVTGNLFCFYNGNSSNSLSAFGIQTANTARAATNYYFLRNDDDVAQAKLGSLRTYHEFESATATSGSFAIDKNLAQVHNIVPTANCTITGYSNMVTSASDGTNTDSQVDTLTIIVEQGATPYTVTLPTGATYKYAGNVSTVGATANAVTMISVTAANVRGTVTYLTTVSPEFV